MRRSSFIQTVLAGVATIAAVSMPSAAVAQDAGVCTPASPLDQVCSSEFETGVTSRSHSAALSALLGARSRVSQEQCKRATNAARVSVTITDLEVHFVGEVAGENGRTNYSYNMGGHSLCRPMRRATEQAPR